MKAMYGAIMGDTVGSVYEWHNIKTKDFPLFGSRCHFTDDSVLTVAVADALANEVEAGRFDTNTDEEWREVFERYLHRYGNVFHGRGYGGGFRRWLHSDDPKPYNSCGNGSAMRVSAVGHFARSLEECERLARLSAEPTHNHPDGVAGAQATAGAVWLALHGGTKEAIKAYVDRFYGEEARAYAKRNGLSAFTLDEIRPLYTFDKYASICRGTVPFAVQAFLESESFEDCLRCTVSIGGDTDTLGAISGAIAEAYYGFPQEFVERIRGYLTEDILFTLDQIAGLDWPESTDYRGKLTPHEAAAFLRQQDRYLILTHVRPDGDTTGCAAALCLILRKMGKTAAVLPNPEMSAGYGVYLKGLLAEEDYVPETVVSVDLAAGNMFPDNALAWRERVDLAIDHHLNGGEYAAASCVDPGRAACGELLCEIAVELGALTPDVALPLYVAIATDTGCFAYPNAAAEAHRAAAKLIGTGFDVNAVNKRHFRMKTRRRIAMEGELYASLEYFDGGRGVFVTIPREMIERLQLDEDDLDDISSLGAQIEGVDCSVTLREQLNGDWKASIRTGQRINAAALCRRFGGGGHAEAAGCIFNGKTLEEAKTLLREAIAVWE